jgi:hypothetical protein
LGALAFQSLTTLYTTVQLTQREDRNIQLLRQTLSEREIVDTSS